MKPAEDPRGKLLPFGPNRERLGYDGRTVEFLYDLEGNLLLLTGEFVVHRAPEFDRVDIHYIGHLNPHDLPCTDYLFHLSRAHLRSTVQATRPGSQVDFLMEKPLLAGDCVKLELWEQTFGHSVQ